MKETLVPGEMAGQALRARPRRLRVFEERDAFARAALHFEDMSENMDRPRMAPIERQRAARRLLGASIFPVLLEAEGVHRKHARVARRLRAPLRENLRHAVAQHPPATEPEVERVSDGERKDISRLVDDDGAVQFERERGVALRPGASRGRVAARRVACARTCRLDSGRAFGELRELRLVVRAHDERQANTMREKAAWVLGERAIDFRAGVPSLRQQKFERATAMRLRLRGGAESFAGVQSDSLVHVPLHSLGFFGRP